jgi:diguanylate cyclase (GGDEF)-like protein
MSHADTYQPRHAYPPSQQSPEVMADQLSDTPISVLSLVRSILDENVTLRETNHNLKGTNEYLLQEAVRLGRAEDKLSEVRADNKVLLDFVDRLGKLEDDYEDLKGNHRFVQDWQTLTRGENGKLVEKNQELSRDPVFGIMTRATWDAGVLEQLQHMRRGTDALRPFVWIADVDYFKEVNDVYGHLVGDMILGRVGAAGREITGEQGPGKHSHTERRGLHPLVGRFGGEEIVFFFPDSTPDMMIKFAEEFKLTVNGILFSDYELNDGTKKNELHGRTTLGISIGISEVMIDPDALEDSLDLGIEAADGALYKIKQNGRNNVLLSTEYQEPNLE